MQDTYSDGLGAMDNVNKDVAKDIVPTHEIIVDIKLDTSIEGHEYKVDSQLTFEIDLESILLVTEGDLSSVLEGLDVDLGDDKDAVAKQLGQPRAIGIVKNINTKTLEISNPDGKIKTELNNKGSLLATLKKNKLLLNFESVLSFPKHTDAYVSIPSMEEMQKNIVIDTKKLEKKKNFKWIEKDKDNLKVEGSVNIKKI